MKRLVRVFLSALVMALLLVWATGCERPPAPPTATPVPPAATAPQPTATLPKPSPTLPKPSPALPKPTATRPPPTPSPRPPKGAELQATSIKITPSLVFPGQAVKVEAEVINAGDVKGTVAAVLKVNGVDTDSRPVTLDPGASDKLSFEMMRDAAGTYAIDIGGKVSNLTVMETKTYSSPQFGYSFAYPGDFTLNADNPTHVQVDRPGTVMQVAVDILDPAIGPAEFARMVADENASVSGFQLTGQKEVRRDEALFGYQQDFSVTTAGGIKIPGTQLLVKRGRYGFAVVAQAEEAIFDENKLVFDAFMAGFKPPAVATGEFTDSSHGFSLRLPTGWDAIETETVPTVLRFNGPPARTTGVRGFVQMTPLARETTAKDHAANVLDSVRQQVPSVKVVSQKDIVAAGGVKGFDTVFTFVQSGVTLQWRDVTLIRGSQSWDIFFIATAPEFAAHQSAIDQLVGSFSFVEPRPFGVVRGQSWFVFGEDIFSLDPAHSEEGAAGIIGAIFGGLVKHGPDLKVTGDIADKWEVSADGTTYTFHIRDGAKFQNGRAVTAADIKFSWERALNPETGSRKALTYLGDIAGARDMASGKSTEISGIKAIDERTLQVTIDGAKPYFLGKLAQPAAFIVDRANVARGLNWTNAPNGTGPFRLKQWKKDDLLILERNEDYYQPVRAKNVVIRIFAGNPMLMYERGEIDMTRVSLVDLERVLDRTNPLNKELLSGRLISTAYIGFNVTKPPFDDINVRRAFGMALDLDKILEVSLKGVASRAAGYVPPGIPGNNPELKPSPFDPARAKELLNQSKYGRALPAVTLYVFRGTGPDVEAMIAMWKQNLGVDVRVEVINELKDFLERGYKREFQLFEGNWSADYIDPQNFLEVLFHSASAENRSAFSNPAIDAALKEAAIEPDAGRRAQKYREIEKTILNELPAIPFFQNWNNHLLSKSYVKGLTVYPISVNHWKDISISR